MHCPRTVKSKYMNHLPVVPFMEALTSTATIVANWEAPADNRWTVPVDGGAGKIMQWGTQPVVPEHIQQGNRLERFQGAGRYRRSRMPKTRWPVSIQAKAQTTGVLKSVCAPFTFIL